MNKKFDMNIENRFEVKPAVPLFKQATGVDKLEREEFSEEQAEKVVFKPKIARKKSEPKIPNVSLKNPARCGLMLSNKQLIDLGMLHVKKKVTIAKMLREALEDYYKNHKDELISKEIIENTSLRIVTIEKSLFKDLKILSVEKGISVSDIGRKAVEIYLHKKS